jgi:hypothetical protein
MIFLLHRSCNHLAIMPNKNYFVRMEIEKVHSDCSHVTWLDRLGIGMALICAVHCLLTPVLIVLLPIIASSFWVDDTFHAWMLSLVAPLTALSFFMGCRKHHDVLLVVIALFGIFLLLCGILFGCTSCNGVHHIPTLSDIKNFPHGFESVFTTLGGCLLVFAHIRNYRLCRKSSCSH